MTPQDDLPRVVSFSGGQTSGFMLRRLIDANEDFRERFKVVFSNTGKEHNATLDFVHDVEKQWEIPIVWVEYDRISSININPDLVPNGRIKINLLKQQANNQEAHWFKIVDYKTAARTTDKITPFDKMLEWAAALPNVRGRSCSAFLKMRTMEKYLRSIGVAKYYDYIGIRYDEIHRAHEIIINGDSHRRSPCFPLCDDKITKQDVDAFWNQNSFKLNIPNHMGNCDLCFLKAKWKRLAITRRNPDVAKWWADWESKFIQKGVTGEGARFRKDQSYQQLINEATHPELDLKDENDWDVPCSCAVGGYRDKSEIED